MLAPGVRIGPFEILALLGEGGMGEVYRARDTALRREVALKTLPEGMAAQPERLARLRREARILAALKHPGIAVLHGLEQLHGAPVLVMELVEGESLSDRLKRAPLPLEDVLRIGFELATAVAAAHEQGVLHRDLKPANIRITPEGRVKVLDFGLARPLAREAPDADSHLSTATSPPSHAGAVLGTAPYMSPEQTRGAEVDRRCDVWAFGCVLYEMLAGRRAFPGASFSEAAAAILEREPEWGALPPGTPYALQRLLRRCLRKDREERLHELADAALELRELLAELSSGAVLPGPGAPLVPSRRGPGRAVAVTAVALGLAGLAGLALWIARPRPELAPIRQPRFQIALPRGVAIASAVSGLCELAISPDGERVAFPGCKERECLLYVRERRELEPRPVPGTEGADCPFFSPDGLFLGFGANEKLKKVPASGGPVVTLADARWFRGGSWGEDGTILFSHGGRGLLRVAASGGDARLVAPVDPARREYDRRFPLLLPRGRAALVHVIRTNLTHEVAVVELATGRLSTLVKDAGFPRYARSGHLLFARQGTVYAAPFDAARLAVTGPAVAALEGVVMWNHPAVLANDSGTAYYDVAREGTLVFSPLPVRLPKRTLVWLDRRGTLTPASSSERAFSGPGLSPDGRHLAVTVQWDTGSRDVFVLDLGRDAWTRITSGGGSAFQAWLPDGERLLALSSEGGRLALLLARTDGTGSPQPLLDGEAIMVAAAPDGGFLLFVRATASALSDIWRLPLAGEGVAQPWLATANVEESPSFSPDGRFVAYVSLESGRNEVLVRPYQGPGPRHQISTQGGGLPRWSRDGREIFFVHARGLWSAAVRTSPGFVAGAPRRLFELPEGTLSGSLLYDPSPDGQRFVLVQKDPFELQPVQLVLVPDWLQELRSRMAAR